MSIVAIGIFEFATAIRAETALGYLSLVSQPPQPPQPLMFKAPLSRRVPLRGHRAERAGA